MLSMKADKAKQSGGPGISSPFGRSRREVRSKLPAGKALPVFGPLDNDSSTGGH